MSEPQSPSTSANSFPPPARSHDPPLVYEASPASPEIVIQGPERDQEDILLTTGGKSRGGLYSRHRPPVSPLDSEEPHTSIASSKIEDKLADMPVLANFIASMRQPQQLSFRRGMHPVTELVWKDLTVMSRANRKGQSKTLLSRVDGKLSHGLTALMGPSGSGKRNTPTAQHITY